LSQTVLLWLPLKRLSLGLGIKVLKSLPALLLESPLIIYLLEPSKEETMEQKATGPKKCPECGSDQYMFRGRRKIPVDAEEGQAVTVETKYLCKTCGHQWKMRVAG
jgi:DNA-directed RNA polymerase subunit RPC12/RpoP